MNAPYINIHTHDYTFQNGIIKVYSMPINKNRVFPLHIPFTAGIHPWDVHQATEENIIDLIYTPENLIGIGEIGLDYSVPNLDKALQRYWFEKQLAVAIEMDLPVVIHCVKAYYETIKILKKYNLTTVIFHGFIGNSHILSELIKNNYLISLGTRSILSYKTLGAIDNINDQLFFIEIDNDKINIVHLYEKISIILKKNTEQMKETIFKNFKERFNYVKLA